MSTDVAVVIVTFESREYIAGCLASLQDGQGGPRIIVVDNASRDGTPQLIRERFPAVTLITSPRNVGFAAGVNRAVGECADARFVFLVNPDSLVMPNAVPLMLAFAEKHPEVGILGPRVFEDPECRRVYPSCRQFPRLTTALFSNQSVLTRLFRWNRFSRFYLYQGEDLSRPRSVDWVSGCAMFVRRLVLEGIGPFDEGFFFFCEDIDFCWRAHKAGWKVMYYPEASVVHFRAKSAERVPYRALVAKHRSMVRLYKKHIRRTVLTDPLVLAGGWVRLGLLLGREALRRQSPY
ncbi:MAG: glycosyltransferase family 2 protein, partial [candidate division NC10 bacterium]